MLIMPQWAWAQPSNSSNPQVLCFGTEEPYCVDCPAAEPNGTPGSTYAWTVISGPFAGSITVNPAFPSQNHILIDWATSPAGNYVLQVIETNADGCAGDPVTLNIQISPLLTATIAPASTPICSDGSAVFNITGPANGTVVINVGGVDVTITLNNAGTGTHTVANATADVTASLVSVSNGTCDNPVTGDATVVVSPLLEAQIVTPVVSPICYQANAVFNFTGTPNTTLNITVNGAAQTVSIGAGGTGTYTASSATVDQVVNLVSITNGTCTNAVTGTATVIVSPLLEATVAPVLTPICYNGTAQFTVTGPANGSVTLTVNGVSQTVSLDASGNGTVTFNNATADVTASLVSVTDGTCTNNVTGSAVVVVEPLLQATVTSITPICSGENAVFNVSGPANGTVTYNVNGGGNATVTLDNAGAGIITVPAVTVDQVVNLVSVSDGTCTNPVTGTATVAINDLLTATIAPASTPICSDGSAVFNITGPANGTVVINVGGVDVTITLNNAGTGTHTVANATADVTASLVSVSNGTCDNPVTGNATVVVSPEFTVDVTAGPQICYEGSAIFTFSGGPANGTVNITVDGVAQTITLDGSGAFTLIVDPATADVDVDVINVSDGTCTYDVNDSGTVVVSPQIVTSGISHN